MAGFYFFLFLTAVLGNDVNGYELQRVVILGRHGLRTPVAETAAELTPKPLPKWNEKLGYLTEKGELLESYMGDYFSAWLKQEGLLPEGCPGEDLVYVHANATQRTRKTAENFVKNAFKNCNVTVHYHVGVKMDPLFDLSIRNSSMAFINIAAKEMQMKIDEYQLKDAFSALNRILDFENSDLCKNKSICDLTATKNQLILEPGEFPDVDGPFKFGYEAAEIFIMQYYSGLPLESIGWGEIKPKDWKLIIKMYNAYPELRFHRKSLVKDTSKPLLVHLTNVLLDDERKFTLLVGHDVNQLAIMAAMGFKDYELKNQSETAPIGGKLVFQKWYDKDLDRYLLKINYVYQSTDQLREAQPLSLENPPESTVLELRGCDVDEDGYCLWDDFVKIAKTF